MDQLFSQESQFADRAKDFIERGERGIRKLKGATDGLDALIKEIEAEKAAIKTAVSTDLTGRGSSLTELKAYRTKFRAVLKTIDTNFPELVEEAPPE